MSFLEDRLPAKNKRYRPIRSPILDLKNPARREARLKWIKDRKKISKFQALPLRFSRLQTSRAIVIDRFAALLLLLAIRLLPFRNE
jgi:hypothetical protein